MYNFLRPLLNFQTVVLPQSMPSLTVYSPSFGIFILCFVPSVAKTKLLSEAQTLFQRPQSHNSVLGE